MKWYRAIWLSCERATFLMSKKEEGKLTLKEKLQLKLHLRICDFCTRFQKQVRFFTTHAPDTHLHTHRNMSEEAKQALKELLKD